MINVPLAAETVFTIGSFMVTNTLVNAFIALVIFFLLGLSVRFGVREIPDRFQTFLEMILEFVLNFFDRVTGSREKSRRFLPIAGTLFFFILLSNWMSLLPGTGSIGVWHVVHRQREFIPLLRPANSDLNLTLAMALVSIVGAHIFGIVTLGLWRHTNKFVQLGNVGKAMISLKPINILTALVEFVVGIIEIFSEFAKIASLSLRLFGNIFAGEVLITVISALVAYLVPLPFIAIEIIVGIVQATVFSMLTLVYLTLMTMPPHGEHQEAHAKH